MRVLVPAGFETRLVAAVLLVGVASGCSINLIRHPKEPEVLKEKIAYFKWLQERDAFKQDPELMREAVRSLLGLKAEGRGASDQISREDEEELLLPALRKLLEDLDQELQRKRTSPKPPP